MSSLVYLDAFMPMDGEYVFSLADRYAPGGTPLARTLQISSDQKMVSLDLDVVADLLYKDCTPADVAYAKGKFKAWTDFNTGNACTVRFNLRQHSQVLYFVYRGKGYG